MKNNVERPFSRDVSTKKWVKIDSILYHRICFTAESYPTFILSIDPELKRNFIIQIFRELLRFVER